MPPPCCEYAISLLVDFLIGFVATHFAECVFENSILLEEVVNGNFTLSVVVHWALEEEAEEALCSPTTGTSSQVAQQYEVKTQRSSEDRVAAKEVDLDLHWVTHPTEDINVIPTFFVVIARWIIIDTNFVVVVGI